MLMSPSGLRSVAQAAAEAKAALAELDELGGSPKATLPPE
jgi:hypothetical protein